MLEFADDVAHGVNATRHLEAWNGVVLTSQPSMSSGPPFLSVKVSELSWHPLVAVQCQVFGPGFAISYAGGTFSLKFPLTVFFFFFFKPVSNL